MANYIIITDTNGNRIHSHDIVFVHNICIYLHKHTFTNYTQQNDVSRPQIIYSIPIFHFYFLFFRYFKPTLFCFSINIFRDKKIKTRNLLPALPTFWSQKIKNKSKKIYSQTEFVFGIKKKKKREDVYKSCREEKV